MGEVCPLLRRSLHSTRYDRLAYVPPRRDPYYPLAAGASSVAPPRLRRSTAYELDRFHYTPYDRPADVPPRRDTCHPVAGASSDAPRLRCSTPYEPDRFHYSPYDRPADAPLRHDLYYPDVVGAPSKAAPPYHPVAASASPVAAPPYYPVAAPPAASTSSPLYHPVAAGAFSEAAPPYHPVAAGAFSEAAPPYHPVAAPPYHPVAPGASSEAPPPYYPVAAPPYHPVAPGASSEAPPLYHPVATGSSSDASPPDHPVASGASSDTTPRLATNAPRPSPYNDSEFPTIGPLFLPNNIDSVRPSNPPRPRPYNPTIIGPIPAGAAYYGVIDASKYDHRGSSASRARRGTTICALCNTKGYHLPTSCPYMVVATQLEIFRSHPPNNLRYQHYFVERRQGIHGCGMGSYAPPRLDVAERAPDVAVSLQKDGLYLVRITNLPEDIKPEPLYKLFDKFGPVTNAIIFIDLSLGFVNFVREEDAEKAMKELNSSGFGHLMWASQTPQ